MDENGGVEAQCAVAARLSLVPNASKVVRVSGAYKKSTSKQCARIQALLKTLASAKGFQDEGAVATFFRDVSNNGSQHDLARICEINGLQKREVQSVLSIYNRMVPVAKQAKQLIPSSNGG